MSVYGLRFQQFPSFWFTYSVVLYVQECSVFGSHIQQFCMSRGVKKKKILSRTRVFKTRVHTGEIFSSDALFRLRAYKNRASGEKKFPQLDLESLKLEILLGKFFFPPNALFRPRAYKNRAFGGKKISPVGSRVLGREPTKIEHLGKKNFPSWISSL